MDVMRRKPRTDTMIDTGMIDTGSQYEMLGTTDSMALVTHTAVAVSSIYNHKYDTNQDIYHNIPFINKAVGILLSMLSPRIASVIYKICPGKLRRDKKISIV
jgi:hypothetical protein